MIVKVFAAATMQEAMARVKSELGIDAVILHTKKVHKGGFLGYMGKEIVEVTAAIEEAPKARSTKPAFNGPVVPKAMVRQYAALPNPDQGNQLEEKSSASRQEAGIEDKSSKERMENKMNDPQAEKILYLQRELERMKTTLAKVMSESAERKTGETSLYEALLENEVDDKIAQEIISGILDESILLNKDRPEAAAHLCDYFERVSRPASGIETEGDRPKIVALIGTTGVGKTTTIAKLAANFVLEKGCSVALITADTYRISAVEQLRTYSDIIGLPLEIVYSAMELKGAIDKHSDKDLILIDTAGRSQHNAFQLNELRDLLAAQADIEKYLVLSATTKYKDAVDIIRKFSLCAPDKLLFTKVDETSGIGMIVNLIHQYPVTLSYFTNGQSVPDDIAVMDARKLAELILR